VWVPKNGAREKHVDRVTDLVTDPRATQYWDEYGAVVSQYDEMFALTGPCAGIFMVYDRDAIWEGATPPQPLYWQDAHARELGRDNIQFDAEVFAAEVRAVLTEE
jgi:hypothetical protein